MSKETQHALRQGLARAEKRDSYLWLRWFAQFTRMTMQCTVMIPMTSRLRGPTWRAGERWDGSPHTDHSHPRGLSQPLMIKLPLGWELLPACPNASRCSGWHALLSISIKWLPTSTGHFQWHSTHDLFDLGLFPLAQVVNTGTSDIVGQMILGCGGWPVCFRMFSSIPRPLLTRY